MNQDTLKGEWMQLKGHVRREWGKLTNDDMAAIKGEVNRDPGPGAAQEEVDHDEHVRDRASGRGNPGPRLRGIQLLQADP